VNIEEDFDKIFQSKINQIESNPIPSEWDKLAIGLDRLKEVDQISNEQFLQDVKKSLNELNPKYSTNDWNKMSAQLDQTNVIDSVEDQKFLDNVKKSLDGNKPTYSSANWNKMESQLDLIRQQRIILWKRISRVAVMLLLCITALRLQSFIQIPGFNLPNNNSNLSIQVPNSNTIDKVYPPKKYIDKTVVPQKENIVVSKTQAPELNLKNSKIIQNLENGFSGNNSLKNSSFSSNENFESNTSDKNLIEYSEFIPSIESTNINSITQLDENKIGSTILSDNPSTKSELIEDISILGQKPLSPIDAYEKLGIYKNPILLSAHKISNPKFKLSMNLNYDLNAILTPYSQESKNVKSTLKTFDNNEDAYTSETWGYGAGINLGYTIRNFEIETGVIYSVKRHEPKTRVSLVGGDQKDGWFGYITRDIEWNILRIPVQGKWNFVNKNKHKVGLIAGSSFNYLVTSSSRSDNFGTTTFADNQAIQSRTNGSIQDGEASGVLARDYFFTGNFGLSYDFNFGKNKFLRLSHVVQQNLSKRGFGPNNDRLDTFTTSLGFGYNF
jgi:hypothetical protein